MLRDVVVLLCVAGWCCVLFVACWLLFVVCGLVSVVCCLLFVVPCSLFVGCYLLCGVC